MVTINKELDSFQPPPFPRYATYSNRRSVRFRMHETKTQVEWAMKGTTRGMPEGGILFERDGHKWTEVWRWQPPLTCQLCGKEWDRWDEVVPLTAPAHKEWHELVYVHPACKRPTGI